MTDREWKRLLRGIQNQRCVLILGPKLGGIPTEEEWNPITEAFAAYLSEELKVEAIEFDSNHRSELSYIAQLFLNVEGVKRIDLEDEAKDFYEQETKTIPPLFLQLAQLPISLVINTNFDNFMARAFNQVGKLCQSGFYNFKRQANFDIPPEAVNVQHPLVYNLYGALEKPESLVITADDQVEFIRNVIKSDPGIPNTILQQFDQSKSYLFLGFNLENWQLRLLLESLNLKEGTSTHMPKMEKYPYSQPTRAVLEQRYKFLFIEKNILEFTEELVKKVEGKGDQNESSKREKRKLYIAYAEEDLEFAIRLESFLKPLKDKGEVETLLKQGIPFGQDIDQAIQAAIEEADVILPILSTDFLANDKLMDQELEAAFEQQKKKETTIIPIIAKACDWKSNDALAKLAPLPLNGVPITSQSWNTVDDAFLHIIKYLKRRLW